MGEHYTSGALRGLQVRLRDHGAITQDQMYRLCREHAEKAERIAELEAQRDAQAAEIERLEAENDEMHNILAAERVTSEQWRAMKAQRDALLGHLEEITRRFKAVAIHTPDDRDYDLTDLAVAVQDARDFAAQAGGQGGGGE